MATLKEQFNELRDKFFNNIHSNNLIYNTCWEDPRCDRAMLKFNSKSKIVMITSAGCNALDYALDNPEAIHTIDMNSRQNALLNLKVHTFLDGDYDNLWRFFGEGKHSEGMAFYANKLKENMPEYSQDFWDKQILQFTKKRSFYFFGTSGTFAWAFNQYINLRPNLRKQINELLSAQSLEEQTEIYDQIEGKIITSLVAWLVNRHLTMTMLGVPRSQRQLILDEYENGVAGYIKERLRHVFTKLPVSDNYFWRLYLTGQYTKDCCPNYLLEENYETLKKNAVNIKQHTTTVSNFLKENPDSYSHYILLDHQDWLAAHDVPALEEEWQLILKNSSKGTKILLRSAALKVDFLPDFVKEAVKFHPKTTEKQHPLDRVGTYGSTYLMTIE